MKHIWLLTFIKINKFILLLLISYFLISNAFTQNDTTLIENNYIEVLLPAIQDNGEIIILDRAPMYPDGVNGIMEHLKKNIKYPKKAKRKDIQGRVLVKFVIQKNGSIGGIEIIDKVHPLLDSEAIRVIKKMKKWIPGILDGKTVNVSFRLPIRFALKEKSKNKG